jgi:diguanylate cyclase
MMLQDWFISGDESFGSFIAYRYHYWLVLLSIVIAALASYTGFDTLDRYGALSHRVTRFAWLATGAITLGGGIWSMHFVAMLAVDMDMAVNYDGALTLLSSLFAIGASGVAICVVVERKNSLPWIVIGGVVLGAGIALMHYTGMSAMRMAANIRYDPLLFTISIVVAVALSSLSLRVLVFGGSSGSLAIKSGGAILMGVSIASVHFTGMAATNFISSEERPLVSSLLLDKTTMVTVIAIGVFIAMQFTLIVSIVHRHFQQKDREMTSRGIYLEKVVENAIDGVALINPKGEIMVVNPVVEQ